MILYPSPISWLLLVTNYLLTNSVCQSDSVIQVECVTIVCSLSLVNAHRLPSYLKMWRKVFNNTSCLLTFQNAWGVGEYLNLCYLRIIILSHSCYRIHCAERRKVQKAELKGHLTPDTPCKWLVLFLSWNRLCHLVFLSVYIFLHVGVKASVSLKGLVTSVLVNRNVTVI